MKDIIGPWRWEILRSDLSPRARLVALALATRMNPDGTIPSRFAPGIRRLAADTGYSKLDSVIAALAELREAGWLEVIESGGQPDRAGARPNNYRALITNGDRSPVVTDHERGATTDHHSALTDHQKGRIRSPEVITTSTPALEPAQDTSTFGPDGETPEESEKWQAIDEITEHITSGLITEDQVLELLETGVGIRLGGFLGLAGITTEAAQQLAALVAEQVLV